MRKAIIIAGMGWLVLASGCTQARSPVVQQAAVSAPDPGERAEQCLKRAVNYRENPVIRAAAIEALVTARRTEALPWIRSALMDEHPAVRFAAAVAVGEMEDQMARTRLTDLVHDEDPNVRVAALYGLHRIGSTSRTGLMPEYLLEHKDPMVRRNAAFVLGRMKEGGVVKMLARAMDDTDRGVRDSALAAMARLGNKEARQQMVFQANSGIGSEEVVALNVLAELRDPVYLDLFLYKLGDTDAHLETRLSAARGLGLLGSEDGYATAFEALNFSEPNVHDPEDNPANQLLRIRQLAASALGAIGKREALPALDEVMMSTQDPRIQVSAALAILEILHADELGEKPLRDRRYRMSP